MPGLLMGVLQVGWLGVGTFFATKFLLTGFGVEAKPGTMPFIVVGLFWGYVMAWIGVKGISYVARVATFLNFIPLLMILVVFSKTAGGIGRHVPSEPNPYVAFTLLLQIVIGFFATAGAAGTDFGANSRDLRDVRWGGMVGIVSAVMVAAACRFFPWPRQGAHAKLVGFNYDAVVSAIGGPWRGPCSFCSR